jgi:hypothetical protein
MKITCAALLLLLPLASGSANAAESTQVDRTAEQSQASVELETLSEA